MEPTQAKDVRVLVPVLVLAAAFLAGCVDDTAVADEFTVPDNAVSSHPNDLVALLNVSAEAAVAPLDLVIGYDVRTTFEDVEWRLTLEDKARFTVFQMGSGGLEKMPGERNMTLQEGTYVVTLDVVSGNATSQAFATVVVELDPNACHAAPEYVAVTAGGERHYVVGGGDEVWQESTGDDELQTPESCPSGPHDTQLK